MRPDISVKKILGVVFLISPSAPGPFTSLRLNNTDGRRSKLRRHKMKKDGINQHKLSFDCAALFIKKKTTTKNTILDLRVCVYVVT